MALFTGLRKGEAMGLCWDRIDFARGTIFIDKQLQLERKKGGKYVFAPLKNDKARTITPAPFVMKLLKRHRAKQAEQRLKLGPMWEDSGLVFTTETGRHLDLHTIQRAYKPIVASIGCPEARFHDLRHLFFFRAAATTCLSASLYRYIFSPCFSIPFLAVLLKCFISDQYYLSSPDAQWLKGTGDEAKIMRQTTPGLF